MDHMRDCPIAQETRRLLDIWSRSPGMEEAALEAALRHAGENPCMECLLEARQASYEAWRGVLLDEVERCSLARRVLQGALRAGAGPDEASLQLEQQHDAVCPNCKPSFKEVERSLTDLIGFCLTNIKDSPLS